MADGMFYVQPNTNLDILARFVKEFTFMSERVLTGIVAGNPSGYVTPSLAATILDGRRVVSELGQG